jgi:hypothetical protein
MITEEDDEAICSGLITIKSIGGYPSRPDEESRYLSAEAPNTFRGADATASDFVVQRDRQACHSAA